jgi:hypothetical protein
MIEETMNVSKEARYRIGFDRLGCVRRRIPSYVRGNCQMIAAEFPDVQFVECHAVRMSIHEEH